MHTSNKLRLMDSILQFSSEDVNENISTNHEAVLCKLSADQCGLLPDKFIAEFVHSHQGHPKRHSKPPIINRGTFLRTVSIDSIVREFIKTNVELDKKYQIISLGAGFDTRLFRFMDEFGNKLDGLKYFEIDFDQVIREKKRIVEKKPILKELSASWRPISFDLNAGISDEIFGKDLDPSVPALIIAECCLMYLTADAGDKIISWSGNTFKSTLTFCSFDTILSDDVKSDPFSKVMLENFEKRGLDTRSLLEYPSRNSAIDRFKKRFSHVDSFTMFQLETTESLVSKQQRRDVLIKAALDEYEEWNLLAEHYLLILARNQHQHKQ